MLLKDLLKAGIHFKLLLADWHAWINKKVGGNLEKIKKVGEYFMEVWKAVGIDLKKVEVVWASDLVKSIDYWEKVLLVAKNITVQRANRVLTIMGRKLGELKEVAQYFYPAMQVADIFQLEVDICQLGLDQRRANILARELGPKLGLWKPVIVSHHMIMGLQGRKEPEGFETSKALDIAISSKMSKSKPENCIFVHDSREEIERKIRRAFCSPKEVENNPILDYTKHIIFRAFESVKVDRPQKYGGPIEFNSYEELERVYRKGELHPADLKAAVVEYLDILIKPIREHFERNKRAREMFELVKNLEITR